MASNYEHLKKLGWLSSYSRKVLLSRYFLRIVFSGPSGIVESDQLGVAKMISAKPLQLIRAAISVNSAITNPAITFHAPYKPSGRPREFFLKVERGIFLFRVVSSNKPTPTSFISFSRNGGEYEFDNLKNNTLAFQILAREILEVSKGTILTTKHIADQRCSELLKKPIWRNMESQHSETIVNAVLNDLCHGITSYWLDWYDSLLSGSPIDLELQFEVALIPDADWEKGSAHIAGLIEGIKARFLADKAPLAEKLELNPATGKFFVTPVPARKPDLLNTTLEKASDALDDALNGRNGLLADDRVARVLRRCFEKYSHNPERIEMDFVDAHVGLTRQMASGELAESEEILSLAEILKNGALDIRANHPAIAANRETRAARALQELTPEQKQQLADAQPVLEAITEAEAHQDMGADIPELINDMIGPVPKNGPPVGPAVRVFNRAAKMSLMMRMKDFDAKLVEKCGYKFLEIFGALRIVIDIGVLVYRLVF